MKPVSLGFQGSAPSSGGEQGRVRPGTTSVCYPCARFRSPAKNWNLVQPVELAVRSETLSAECPVRLPDAAVQTKRPCRPLRGSGVARSTLRKAMETRSCVLGRGADPSARLHCGPFYTGKLALADRTALRLVGALPASGEPLGDEREEFPRLFRSESGSGMVRGARWGSDCRKAWIPSSSP